MNVVTTGICARSASTVRSLDAQPRMTPFPARIRGCSARLMMSAARASDGRSGEGRRGRSARSGSPSAGPWATSSGSSRWQAPGFSSWARLNAFRTASATTAPVSMRAFHFVNGLNTSTIPVARFVAPGPSVARHTPAWPVRRPQTSAMKAAACSCRTGTNWMDDRASASLTCSVSSPGTPNTYRTPSRSRQRTNSSAPVITRPPGRSCRSMWTLLQHGLQRREETSSEGASSSIRHSGARRHIGQRHDGADEAQDLVVHTFGYFQQHHVTRALDDSEPRSRDQLAEALGQRGRREPVLAPTQDEGRNIETRRLLGQVHGLGGLHIVKNRLRSAGAKLLHPEADRAVGRPGPEQNLLRHRKEDELAKRPGKIPQQSFSRAVDPRKLRAAREEDEAFHRVGSLGRERDGD